MIKYCRVVACNVDLQTVDLLESLSYTSMADNNQASIDNIIENVPYMVPIAHDHYMPESYWGLLKRETNAIGQQRMGKRLAEYGPSFLFGRHGNPKYLKYINEKYYQKKGTNVKVANSGVSYRPPEGSIAVYDEQHKLVLGFVNPLADYVAYDRTRKANPSKKNLQPEYDPDYLNKVTADEVNILQRIRRQKASIGYGNELDIPNENIHNRIDFVNEHTLEAKTYQMATPYLLGQDVERARVEDVTVHYKRYKQNDLKRITDQFDLQIGRKGETTFVTRSLPKLHIPVTAQELPNQGVFNGVAQYDPALNILTPDFWWLDDANVYDNLVKSSDIDESGTDVEKEMFYRERQKLDENGKPIKDENGEEKRGELENIYITPESGILRYRDGKMIIFADMTDTHADGLKPLKWADGEIKLWEDVSSPFYNEPVSHDDIINAWIERLSGITELSESKLMYAFDTFDLGTDTINDSEIIQRKIPFMDERGSYIGIDQSYIEIISDTKKGGYLFMRSNKAHTFDREYRREIVMAPMEAVRKLLKTSDLNSPDCPIQLDHKNPDLMKYEIPTDYRMREGTRAIEAPLLSFDTYREYHKAIGSIAFNVQNERYGYSSRIIMGASSSSPIGDAGANDGGCVIIQAGSNTVGGGSLADTAKDPLLNKGGRIVLDAHEVHINANRILLGAVRLDQILKMLDLDVMTVACSCIPMWGQAVEKGSKLLKNNYPVRNEFDKALIV